MRGEICRSRLINEHRNKNSAVCSLLGSGLGYVVLCPFPPGLVRGVKGIGGGCGTGRWGGWTKQCSFSMYMKSRSFTMSFVKLAKMSGSGVGSIFVCLVVARRVYAHGRNWGLSLAATFMRVHK